EHGFRADGGPVPEKFADSMGRRKEMRRSRDKEIRTFFGAFPWTVLPSPDLPNLFIPSKTRRVPLLLYVHLNHGGSMSKKLSRRDFLRTSAAVAAPVIVPASVFGTQDKAAPSERLGIGHIGVGTMGYNHVKGLLGEKGAQIIAVCDVDKDRREFNQKTVEKGYSKDTTYKGCAVYNDHHELLARKDIDAVVIAAPDHWHAALALDAMKAGKDVYCEKPLTLTIHEAKTLIDAARKLERVFQTGSQQRSDWEFQVAVNMIH